MFQIHKTLALPRDPFKRGVYTRITEAVEKHLTKQLRVPIILTEVNYRAVKRTQVDKPNPNMDYYFVETALTNRDK